MGVIPMVYSTIDCFDFQLIGLSHCAIVKAMKKLMSKWFDKWAKKSKTTMKCLLAAIEDMESGNVVDLGSGLYKIRVSRQNQGKSSGYRTLLIYKKERLAVFIYGFAKNERDNISAKELMLLKKQAKQILKFNQNEIDHAIECGELIKLED